MAQFPLLSRRGYQHGALSNGARNGMVVTRAGIVFVAGLRGAKQTKAARSVGLAKTTNLSGLRIEASDKPGLLQKLLTKLPPAGITLRGVSASVIGNRCVIMVAFESAADRDKGVRLLRV
jgi:hypothetical protein